MFNNKQNGASPMLNRKKNNNIKDIENEVNQWRKQNIKKVEINLFPGEKEYLVENLDCKVMPILYEIKEKNIDNLRDCPNFIKNKLKHKGKCKRVLRLENGNLKYWIVKKLNTNHLDMPCICKKDVKSPTKNEIRVMILT